MKDEGEPGGGITNTREGQMARYREALESARRAFNEILTIHWGWDGDCGALTYANDGFDTCDKALKHAPAPEAPESSGASGTSTQIPIASG